MSTEKSTRIDYKLVNLNSANALVKNNGTFFSDVLFKFPGLVKPEPNLKLVELSIVDAQIPVSFYNLNYTNNTLNYQISSVNYSITANVGNYNFNSLATELISKFLLNGHIFTITINKQNGIMTFATSATNFIFQVSSIFVILGFTNSNKNSTSFSLTADYPLNLLGITKIKIQSSNLGTYNLDSSNQGYCNTLGIIPVDQPSFGLIIYENKTSSYFALRDNRVDEIDLQLLDQNNYLINFNNIDWDLTILFKFTREIEILSKTDMADVLKQQNKILENMIGQNQQPIDTPQVEQPINPIQTDDLEFFLYTNPNINI